MRKIEWISIAIHQCDATMASQPKTQIDLIRSVVIHNNIHIIYIIYIIYILQYNTMHER